MKGRDVKIKKVFIFAITILISLMLNALTNAATGSEWILGGSAKVGGANIPLGGFMRLESNGTIQLPEGASVGTWSRAGSKLKLNFDKNIVQFFVNPLFSKGVSGMGHSSGNFTIDTLSAAGKFLSDSIIQGVIKAKVKVTLDGQGSSDIPVTIDFFGVLCKNGFISGTINEPHCGCVEARNLATGKNFELGCMFSGENYGEGRDSCVKGVPPGTYEVCLRDFCGGTTICKTVTVGEGEVVTVNFP